MEEWHSRGIAQESTVSMLLIATTDRGGTEQWTSGSLGDVPQVQKPALQLHRTLKPFLHTSTQRPGTCTSLHMTTFTKPFPVLVLQATNVEARRPGHEAKTKWG